MTARKTIDDMIEVAAARGGKCVSDTYVNAHTPLSWECRQGHRWRAVPNKVQQGRWCPVCASGLGERICRAFFEQLFRKRFPKVRPAWLVNQRGYRMELDGYCRSIGVAFEHQGRQHFTASIHYMTDAKLRARQDDDKCKRDLCAQHGIVLIEIPEIGRRLPINHIRPFIRNECIRNGIQLPDDFDSREIHLRQAYSTFGADEQLRALMAVAKNKGGKCVSELYKGSGAKLRWECAKGHQWEAVPDSIIQGAWCPACAGVMKKRIEEMQQLARRRGGKCLSDAYVNAHTPLSWECKHGHRWLATPHKVQQGTWCRHCAGLVKGTIEQMRQIAEGHGGRCLSDTYVNSVTKLLWECIKGHQWEAVPSSVKSGRWCPVCGGSAKGSIEEMRQLAKKRGGKCLSNIYINNKTKLLWECAKGHRWEAAPANIKGGTWCPVCAGTMKSSIEEMHTVAHERGGRCLSDTYVNSMMKLLWECAKGHRWRATPHSVKRGSWCPICARTLRQTYGLRP